MSELNVRSRPRAPALTQTFKSVAAGGASRALVLPVTAVSALLTTRIQITALGVHQFAFVSLVLSLSLLLPFADLGVGAAIVNRTAQSNHPASDPDLRRTLLTSIRVLACTGTGILLLDAVVTYAHWWPSVVGLQNSPMVHDACGLAVAVFALALPVSIGQRLLLGLGRNGTLVLLQAVTSPLALLVTLVAEERHAGLLPFALALPTGSLAVGVLQTVVAGRLSGINVWHLLQMAVRRSRHPGGRVRVTAGPMVVVMLGLPLALQTDRLILAHASSSEQVAQYAVGLLMYSPLWSIVASAGMSLWPVFANQRSTGTDSPLVQSAVRAFLLIGLGSGLAAVVTMPWLSRLVGAGQVYVPLRLAAAFACLLLVQSVQLPLGMFLTSPSGLRFQAVCVSAMVPVSCVTSYVLSGPWGAVGPLAGSVLAILACQVVPGLVSSGVLPRGGRRGTQEPGAERRALAGEPC